MITRSKTKNFINPATVSDSGIKLKEKSTAKCTLTDIVNIDEVNTNITSNDLVICSEVNKKDIPAKSGEGSTTKILEVISKIWSDTDEFDTFDSGKDKTVVGDESVTLGIIKTIQMATKDELEELLKKEENYKIAAFQPVVFSGQSSVSAQDFLTQFDNYTKLSCTKDADKMLGFNLLYKD